MAVVTRHMGDVVRQLREQRGLSMGALSRRSGVDMASLSRLEAHKQHLLSQENMTRVAQALEMARTELEHLAGGGNSALPEWWPSFEEIVERDPNLTKKQKAALVAVYQTYRRR